MKEYGELKYEVKVGVIGLIVRVIVIDLVDDDKKGI